MNREKIIVKVSVQGIVVNLILVAFKAAIGLMTNSIAVILDAVNNLSDALSQVITIVGTKLSQKEPDKKHPYGYGRIEYFSSAVVAALIMFAGFTSVKESIEKILHPVDAEYSMISLIIIGVAVVVKFLFGRYVKGTGEKVQSQALIASGTEALIDSVLSLSTFGAAMVNRIAHIGLEGILGLILSLFILKTGMEILRETLSSLIGSRVDADLSQNLKKQIRAIPGVRGAYDLILHDYGPSRSIGSVHIEVEAGMTAREIHHLSRRIIEEIYQDYGILLTVGIYASNETEGVPAEIYRYACESIKEYPHILQLHGFYVDGERKQILFDIVVSHHAASANELAKAVQTRIESVYPAYVCQINIDHDFSD